MQMEGNGGDDPMGSPSEVDDDDVAMESESEASDGGMKMAGDDHDNAGTDVDEEDIMQAEEDEGDDDPMESESEEESDDQEDDDSHPNATTVPTPTSWSAESHQKEDMEALKTFSKLETEYWNLVENIPVTVQNQYSLLFSKIEEATNIADCICAKYTPGEYGECRDTKTNKYTRITVPLAEKIVESMTDALQEFSDPRYNAEGLNGICKALALVIEGAVGRRLKEMGAFLESLQISSDSHGSSVTDHWAISGAFLHLRDYMEAKGKNLTVAHKLMDEILQGLIRTFDTAPIRSFGLDFVRFVNEFGYLCTDERKQNYQFFLGKVFNEDNKKLLDSSYNPNTCHGDEEKCFSVLLWESVDSESKSKLNTCHSHQFLKPNFIHIPCEPKKPNLESVWNSNEESNISNNRDRSYDLRDRSGTKRFDIELLADQLRKKSGSLEWLSVAGFEELNGIVHSFNRAFDALVTDVTEKFLKHVGSRGQYAQEVADNKTVLQNLKDALTSLQLEISEISELEDEIDKSMKDLNAINCEEMSWHEYYAEVWDRFGPVSVLNLKLNKKEPLKAQGRKRHYLRQTEIYERRQDWVSSVMRAIDAYSEIQSLAEKDELEVGKKWKLYLHARDMTVCGWGIVFMGFILRLPDDNPCRCTVWHSEARENWKPCHEDPLIQAMLNIALLIVRIDYAAKDFPPLKSGKGLCKTPVFRMPGKMVKDFQMWRSELTASAEKGFKNLMPELFDVNVIGRMQPKPRNNRKDDSESSDSEGSDTEDDGDGQNTDEGSSEDSGNESKGPRRPVSRKRRRETSSSGSGSSSSSSDGDSSSESEESDESDSDEGQGWSASSSDDDSDGEDSNPNVIANSKAPGSLLHRVLPSVAQQMKSFANFATKAPEKSLMDTMGFSTHQRRYIPLTVISMKFVNIISLGTDKKSLSCAVCGREKTDDFLLYQCRATKGSQTQENDEEMIPDAFYEENSTECPTHQCADCTNWAFQTDGLDGLEDFDKNNRNTHPFCQHPWCSVRGTGGVWLKLPGREVLPIEAQERFLEKLLTFANSKFSGKDTKALELVQEFQRSRSGVAQFLLEHHLTLLPDKTPTAPYTMVKVCEGGQNVDGRFKLTCICCGKSIGVTLRKVLSIWKENDRLALAYMLETEHDQSCVAYWWYHERVVQPIRVQKASCLQARFRSILAVRFDRMKWAAVVIQKRVRASQG